MVQFQGKKVPNRAYVPKLTLSVGFHGGLSHWGRSNRPRIRPGTVKSLNAPCELS